MSYNIRKGYLLLGEESSQNVHIMNGLYDDSNIFAHKNCSSCEEKIFIGYIIKAMYDDLYCTVGSVAWPPGAMLIHGGTVSPSVSNCAKGAININPFGPNKFLFKVGTDVDDFYGLNGYICGAGDALTQMIYDPTYVIENTTDYENAVCTLPDNFSCSPLYMRIPTRMDSIFFGYFNFHSPIDAARQNTIFVNSSYNKYYDFEGLTHNISRTEIKTVFPYNTRRQCNYTLSLQKDIYEVDIDLFAWGKLFMTMTPPGSTDNPLHLISTDYVTQGGNTCYSLPTCTDFDAYREPREWFRFVNRFTRNNINNFTSWCRTKTRPGDCYQALDIINQLKKIASLSVVDTNYGATEEWEMSTTCCIHYDGIMHDFEDYCCNKNHTDLTSKLNCSEGESTDRSFVLRFPSLTASVLSGFDGSPDGNFIRYDQHLLEYKFPFNVSVCPSKHKSELISITPGQSLLLGPCTGAGVDPSGEDAQNGIKFEHLYTPIMVELTKTVTVEMHYCVKSYTPCS